MEPTKSNQEGFLLKRSPTMIKDFKKRYFRIENDESNLTYYKSSNNQNEPLGSIPILSIIDICSAKDNDFEIIIRDRIYYLRA